MTTNEALAKLGNATIQAYSYRAGWQMAGDERFARMMKAGDDEALSVLRAVVEDYEKARPLIRAAMNMEMMEYCPDNSHELNTLMREALAYREGRKA